MPRTEFVSLRLLQMTARNYPLAGLKQPTYVMFHWNYSGNGQWLPQTSKLGWWAALGVHTDGADGCRSRGPCRLSAKILTWTHVLREATHAQIVEPQNPLDHPTSRFKARIQRKNQNKINYLTSTYGAVENRPTLSFCYVIFQWCRWLYFLNALNSWENQQSLMQIWLSSRYFQKPLGKAAIFKLKPWKNKNYAINEK